jgi:hypothetical protein
MDKETIKRKIRAGNFIENNGVVLRTVNILRHEYNKLSGICYALPDLEEDEFLDSINYLHEEGYIHLRDTETKAEAVTGLADIDYRQLEAKLTGKGIKLLAGGIADACVKA